jgi:hypothetical protein|tara:strand:- start:258 stop:764 length:507 start_codon:yes stop_codon:yes gene_type:complete
MKIIICSILLASSFIMCETLNNNDNSIKIFWKTFQNDIKKNDKNDILKYFNFPITNTSFYLDKSYGPKISKKEFSKIFRKIIDNDVRKVIINTFHNTPYKTKIKRIYNNYTSTFNLSGHLEQNRKIKNEFSLIIDYEYLDEDGGESQLIIKFNKINSTYLITSILLAG